ncbi:MAG: ABC-type transport auxiliary lipoprotein family protein [Lautropia sp.]|nr:ABC-type transport auxiliary lipoprotein family protein [Lautropia sp.]
MKKGLGLLGTALLLAGCASSPPVNFYTLYAPLDADRPTASRAGTATAFGTHLHPAGQQPAGPVADDAPSSGADPAFSGATSMRQPDLRFEIASVDMPERLDRVNIVIHPLESRGTGRGLKQAGEESGPDGEVRHAVAHTARTAITAAAAASANDMALIILENSRFDAVLSDAFRDALATHLATIAAIAPHESTAAANDSAGSMTAPARLRLTLQVYRFDARSDGRLDSLIDWRIRRLARAGEEVSDREHAGLACRFQSSTQAASGRVDALVAGMQQQLQTLARDIVAGSRQWLGNPSVAQQACHALG